VSQFAFVACQVGAERTIFQHLTPPHGPWKKAFSRPGFVTLKLEDGEVATPDSPSTTEPTLPISPFVRTTGWGLGHVSGNSVEELAEATCQKLDSPQWDAVHFWHRDPTVPGWNGYEPGTADEDQTALSAIKVAWQNKFPQPAMPPLNVVATGGEKILDIIAVESNQWWIGYHTAHDRPSGWPGGVLPIHRPSNMISRAYLKMTEAIAWSRFDWQPGDHVVEIGSSPGGSCQRLLEIGLNVTGIDPAEMHESLMIHPNFTHWRGKAAQLKRKMFRKFRWLTADANVAASYTLDAVEAVVTYPGVNIEGMLLTLKMSEWSQASDISLHIARIKSWGFPLVSIRQLAYNRREVCVAASRLKSSTKQGSAKKRAAQKRRSKRLGQMHPNPRQPATAPKTNPTSKS
jgi:23S rRNA (cytidine2498-2'-O)-methyltransferase